MYCLLVFGEPELGIFDGSKWGGQHFCGEDQSVRELLSDARVGHR